MFAKLFASLYQGTLRGHPHEILVFTNLLAHCDASGYVDKHFRAIAEETGLSVDQVKIAILNLEAPDPESRSALEKGARLTRMEPHRDWGWKVVNYIKYRLIRSQEDRRAQNRLAQQRWRDRRKDEPITTVKRKQSKSRKPKEKEKHKKHTVEKYTPLDYGADGMPLRTSQLPAVPGPYRRMPSVP